MSKIFRTLYYICLLIMLVATIRADSIDDLIRAEMKRQNIPGISVAIVKDGKTIKAQGYGLANLEHEVPASAETVYKIASVSKQFIASGILLLVQEKKIDLNDKVSKFLDGTPETWKDITIRHLLTHTSGIVREPPNFDPLKIQNDAEVIKSAYPLPLRFPPGERFEYSNSGYFILAEIISKVSQKTWTNYLTERLFTPLGMVATRPTSISALVPKRADGYVRVDNKTRNAEDYLAVRPCGAFLSSVSDLAKWDAALYSSSILNQTIREQMWSPVTLNSGSSHPYGFVWYLETITNHKAVRHGGSLPGFRAEFIRFTNDKLSVIILANGDNANLGPLALVLANHYISGLIPKRNEIKVDRKILQAYVGKYQPNPNSSMSVTREGDKLWLESNNDRRELLAESDANFFTPGDPRLTFTFINDEKGSIVYLKLFAEGREIGRARKIE